jgi:hypothetical protein
MTTTATTTTSDGNYDGDYNEANDDDVVYHDNNGDADGGSWGASRRRGVGQASGGQDGGNGNKSEMGTMWV